MGGTFCSSVVVQVLTCGVVILLEIGQGKEFFCEEISKENEMGGFFCELRTIKKQNKTEQNKKQGGFLFQNCTISSLSISLSSLQKLRIRIHRQAVLSISKNKKIVIVIECVKKDHATSGFREMRGQWWGFMNFFEFILIFYLRWGRPFAACDIFNGYPVLFVRWNPDAWKVNDVTLSFLP